MKKTMMVLALLLASPAMAMAGSVWDRIQEHYRGPLDIKVYHSADCGCCKDWMKHLETHGFTVEAIETGNVDLIKQEYRLPSQVASCHTAVIDGYIIEGHVPADDIKRLLKRRPAIRGLAVPQMPVGTPGMEMGGRKDPFAVISFDDAGNYAAFSQYWSY